MGYFKPNSKKAIKLAIAVKSFTGVLAGSIWVSGDSKSALIVFIIGAAANEVINFLSDDEKESKRKDKEDEVK